MDIDLVSFAVGYSHGRRLAAMRQAAADYEQTAQQAQISDISEDAVHPQDTIEQGQESPNNNT